MGRKRKDPAAVALGRKGGKARLKSLSPERRSEIARNAVLSRYGKAKPPTAPQPGRWFGLLVIPDDPAAPESGHIGDLRYSLKRLDAAHAHPDVVLWSRDRAEVVERSRQKDLSDRWTEIIDVDYDPTRFTIQREFAPDVGRQLKALRGLVDADAEEGGQS